MSRGLSLWLVPEPRACAALETLNLTLAARYGGPRFLPHLTVFAGRFARDEDLVAVVRDAARGRAFELAVEGVRTGPAFYRSVFVALAGDRRLEALAERAHAASRGSDHVLEPHVSLFYGTPSEAVLREIAGCAVFDRPAIRFQELVVNTSPGESGTPEGVARWAPTLRLPILGG